MHGTERIRKTMVRDFNPSDEGTAVHTADGDEIGHVQAVEGSMAHVKPSSNLSQSIRQRLGWTKENEAVYELDHDRVDEFTDDGILLKD
jgi:hypothetical protein